MHRRKLLQWGLSAVGAGLVPFAAARADDDIIGAILQGKHPSAPAVPAAPAIGLRPTPVESFAAEAVVEPRWVKLRNIHTDEKLEAVYWENGEYVPDAVQALNHVLRDYRNDEVHPIDPGLYDILGRIAEKTQTKAHFQVISGYRSPATNRMLSERSGEVARHSLHMDGKAMDIFLEDIPLQEIRAEALGLKLGGVGYYPKSRFVHVDVGRVRTWSGT